MGRPKHKQHDDCRADIALKACQISRMSAWGHKRTPHCTKSFHFTPKAHICTHVPAHPSWGPIPATAELNNNSEGFIGILKIDFQGIV